MKEAKKTFEENEKRLTEIVEKLEGNNASLDESMALFEEGISLVGQMNKMLDEAEQRVKILTGEPEATDEAKE